MERTDWDRYLDDLHGDDPRRALNAYRDLAEVQLPWLEQRVVGLAVEAGWNWTTIGRLLGRSRQAVRAKFGDVIQRPAPEAPWAAYEREIARLEAIAEAFSAARQAGVATEKV